MNSTITFIISVAAILIFAVCIFCFEKKTKWEGQDERQILIVLKSSTIGFYSLLVFCLIDVLAIRSFELPFKPEVLIIISIFFSYTIFLVRELWFDNLYSRFFKPKFFFVIVTIILVVLDVKLCRAYFEGSHALENLLIFSSMTLCYFVCSVTIAIRFFINRKKASGDEN